MEDKECIKFALFFSKYLHKGNFHLRQCNVNSAVRLLGKIFSNMLFMISIKNRTFIVQNCMEPYFVIEFIMKTFPNIPDKFIQIYGGKKKIALGLVGHFNGLVQDCSISSALAMEILQSCAKPSICAIWVRIAVISKSKLTFNCSLQLPFYLNLYNWRLKSQNDYNFFHIEWMNITSLHATHSDFPTDEVLCSTCNVFCKMADILCQPQGVDITLELDSGYWLPTDQCQRPIGYILSMGQCKKDVTPSPA